MKKSIIHSPASDPGRSIIDCLETDYRRVVEALFERIYPLPDEVIDHPPVKLRYMIDDYWELLLQANSD